MIIVVACENCKTFMPNKHYRSMPVEQLSHFIKLEQKHICKFYRPAKYKYISHAKPD